MSFDSSIHRALSFIDSLRVDDTRTEYFEVVEQNHSEYRVYNQSQYLLTVMFKQIGRNDLVQAIIRKHPPNEKDNDLRRRRHKANNRFCVLEGDIKNFYLAKRRSSRYNDEMAPIALGWLLKDHPRSAQNLWRKIYSRYDPSKGVLKMDKADLERNLYPVYKVALLGILAKKLGKTNTIANVQSQLRSWQHQLGGWETDRKVDLRPDGVANIETTALTILALLPQ